MKIEANIFDEEKAKAFNAEYLLAVPYQEFKHFLKMRFKKMGIDTTFYPENKSYLIYSDVYGQSEKVFTLAKDTGIDQRFILWYQPLNFTNDRIFYYYNNKLFESNLNMETIDSFHVGKDNDISFAEHTIQYIDDNSFYYGEFVKRNKLIYKDKDSSVVVDFEFKKFNKANKGKEVLFAATEVVDDRMLNPELFEDSESPLYEYLDIYHWNWLQVNDNKMLINYAFTGFQQIDLSTKKVDWHWGYKHHTFDKIEGVGDLTGPYYTHHINKIESGPHKGRYSYFENGSEPVNGRKYRPARGRIIEIDTVNNTAIVVWEKVFDFATIALGSINVFDDYILVNVGLGLPLNNINDTFKEKGKIASVEYYNLLKRPMLYLYDAEGNPISEYIYEPGFYSYIASPIKRN